jgi:hypothetical protein
MTLGRVAHGTNTTNYITKSGTWNKYNKLHYEKWHMEQIQQITLGKVAHGTNTTNYIRKSSTWNKYN